MEIEVTFVIEVGVRDMTFEGDSLVICNAIYGLTEAAPSVHNVVIIILKRVQDFHTLAFSHIKRQGNAPAHVLVKNLVRHILNCQPIKKRGGGGGGVVGQ